MTIKPETITGWIALVMAVGSLLASAIGVTYLVVTLPSEVRDLKETYAEMREDAEAARAERTRIRFIACEAAGIPARDC